MKNTFMIKKNSIFTRVLKKGSWYSGDLMTLYVLKNDDMKCNMLGIAVSKKYSKSSVRRNRVKRLIKEVYRLAENNVDTGHFLVIVWKNNVEYEQVTFENVKNDFYKCMKKAILYTKGTEEFV